MGKLGDLLNEFDTGTVQAAIAPIQQPIQQQSSKLSGLLNAFDSGEPEVIAEPVQTTKFDEQGVVGSELAPPTQEQEQEADVLLGTAEPESKLAGLMKGFETKEAPIAPVKFKGFFNELGRGLVKDTLGAAAGIAGTVQSVEDFLNQGKFGGTGEDIADFLREKQKGIAPTVGGSKVKKFIANAISGAVPFMAATVGATLVGGPVAGVSVAFSIEGDQAYQEAIENGATEEEANLDRMVVGSINAALEKLQIDKIFGGAKVSGKIIKDIVKAAKAKAGKEVAKLGKKLTVETFKTAVTEGIQEGLQEITSVAAPAVREGGVPTLGEVPERALQVGKKLVEERGRIGQSALGGFVVGGIFSGGGGVIQSLSETSPDADGFRTVELETPEAAQEAATAIADKATADGFDVEVKTDNNKLSVKESGVPVLGDKPGEDSQADSFNQRIEEIGDIVSAEEIVEQAPQVETEAKVEVQPAIEGEEAKAAQTEREAADVQEELQFVNVPKKELKRIKKEAHENVLSDPIFEIHQEVLEQRKSEIDIGVFSVPENLRAEVNAAIEDDPSLRFNISFDKTKGMPYDTAIQEGFLQREDDTTGHLDISEFLSRVSEAKQGTRKIGGISEVVLDKMIASRDPFSEINAVKHKMLHEGFSIEEINEAIEDVAGEYDIEFEPITFKDAKNVEKSPRLPEETPQKKRVAPETPKKQPTKKERLAAKPKVAPKKFKPKAIPAGTPTSKSREKALEKFQKDDSPKQRGLSKSIEKATVEKGLTDFFENIPEFQSVDLKEQASESSALVNKSPEQAKRIAMGQEVAPKGVIPEMVLVAVSNKALQEGDVDTLRDIATSSRLTQEATTMGQRIRALGELDKASPIKAMVKVAKVREEVFTKKNKKRKIKAEKKSEVVKIKDSIKKAKVKNGAKALNDFISALEC